jgi:hypothetical protein
MSYEDSTSRRDLMRTLAIVTTLSPQAGFTRIYLDGGGSFLQLLTPRSAAPLCDPRPAGPCRDPQRPPTEAALLLVPDDPDVNGGAGETQEDPCNFGEVREASGRPNAAADRHGENLENELNVECRLEHDAVSGSFPERSPN